MVCVINQNRFRRVFGTVPDGPFAQVGRHCCGSYRVEQRAAVSSGGVSRNAVKHFEMLKKPVFPRIHAVFASDAKQAVRV